MPSVRKHQATSENGRTKRAHAALIRPSISAAAASWPPGSATPKYTFSQVIQFNPQGEAQIINGPNVDGQLQYIEIDLEPMHGKALPTPQNPNNAAILIDGVSGSIRIFRT